MAEKREYVASLQARFVDDDDLVRSGRALLEVDGHEFVKVPVPDGWTDSLNQVEKQVTTIENIAENFGSMVAVVWQLEQATAAAEKAQGAATKITGAVNDADKSAKASATSEKNAAASAEAAKTSEKTSADNATLVKNAANSAKWEGDQLVVLGVKSGPLRGGQGLPGVVVSETQPTNGEVWINPKGKPTKSDTSVGVVLVETAAEAAELPLGTLYVVTGVKAPTVAITGHATGAVNGTTFTPNIPGASAGDRVVVGVNAKAVSGMTITPPQGFETLLDAYWTGTQTSWLFVGMYPPGGEFVVSAAAELSWAAVAATGVTSHAVGKTKDRGTAPAESTTVTALPVEAKRGDIVLGFAFERTTANETPEQVTVNAGWEKVAYAAQGTNIQTVLVAKGEPGSTMTATYPNPQGTNGLGVQVVLRG